MSKDNAHNESESERNSDADPTRRSYLTRTAATASALGVGTGAMGSVTAGEDGKEGEGEKTDDTNEDGGEGDNNVGGRNGPDVTEIDECTTITESGHYRLTTDLEVPEGESCIVIDTSDVVFDGDGYTITGGNPAVFVFGDNVRVHNLAVESSRLLSVSLLS